MEKDLNENDDGNGKKMKIDFFFLSFLLSSGFSH